MRAPKLTRRSLFKAAAAGTAAAGVVGVVAGCSNNAADDPTPEPTVVEADDATDIYNTFIYDGEKTFEPQNTWSLPRGNVLHPGEGTWLGVTTAGSSSTPMVKASAFSTETGELLEVVSAPRGTATTTVIYDVCCSDEVFAWVELDLTTRDWALYAAGFSAGVLSGDVKSLWQASSDYDPAPFAVSGSTVIWQVQPSLSGTKTAETSYCYLWRLGSPDAKAVVESHGRFATKPTISSGVAVLAPRVRNSEGTYYGVTAYTLSNDFATKLDQLVMPAGVRPFHATRVGERLLVSVEASYSSGGLLGKMGTYLGTPSAGFAYFNREPSACGCGKDDTFVIKTSSYYYVIDMANGTYSYLSSADRALDYGEYPARVGDTDLFVTFSTVKDKSTGYPASVTVRTFHL